MRLNIKLDDTDSNALDVLARAHHVSRSDLVRVLVFRECQDRDTFRTFEDWRKKYRANWLLRP